MRRQVSLLLFAVVLWGAVGAISSAVGAAAPEQLQPGVYTTIITLADIPGSFPPEMTAILVGSWELEFFEDRTAVARKAGVTVVTASYVANPAHLVIRDTGGTLACAEPGTATGVYSIGVNADRVTATAIHDQCLGRELIMTAHPWQKL